MNQTLNTARVGLFFLLGVGLIWVVYQALGEGVFIREEGYRVTASFDDIKQLKTGDEVRLAGVRVGSVSRADLVGGRAHLTLTINRDVEIPEDSVAMITMSGLLGSHFVSIRMGTAETHLAEGDSVPTETTMDFNDALASLGQVSARMEDFFDEAGHAFAMLTGDEETDGVITNLNHILLDNREQLREMLANFHSISDSIAQGEGTLGKLIRDDEAYESLMSISGNIETTADEAALLVRDLRDVVAQLKSGEGTLGMLLYDDTTAEELRRMTRNLGEVSEKLAAGEGTLGRLLVDDTIYKDLQSVLQKAERTIDGLGDQGPITAVGITANALF